MYGLSKLEVPPKNWIPRFVKRLLPLYLVVFIGFVGYSLMITVFTPLFINGHGELVPKHWSLSTRSILLGVILSLYPLGQFLGSPILGALSDRFGRARPLHLSLGACIGGYVLIALSIESEILWLLMGALFLTGIIEANIVIAQSSIADVVKPEDRGRWFGYIYVAVSTAYIVGPLFGGRMTDSNLVSFFGPSTPFWAAAILVIVSLACSLLIFRETLPVEKRVTGSLSRSLGNLSRIFTERDVRSLYLANFLIYLAIFGFFRCYPMFIVDKFNMDISTESEFIAWVAVPLILVNFVLIGPLSRRFSYRTLAIVSGVAIGVLMAVVVVPSQEWMLWITLFVVTIPVAMCMTSIAAMISSAVGAQRQGRVMGNNQAVQVGAEALSGLLGGFFAAIAIWLPMVALGAIAIVGVAVLLFTRRGRAV